MILLATANGIILYLRLMWLVDVTYRVATERCSSILISVSNTVCLIA
jgi:hypothetical protein